MIRALLDTNVILDALFAREPFGAHAAVIWQAHEDGRFIGYLSAITPSTVFYIARKTYQREKALRMVIDLVETFEISPVGRTVLHLALQLNFGDFEDAIQVASAMNNDLDCIVTRNVKDYGKSPIEIISPPEFIARLKQSI